MSRKKKAKLGEKIEIERVTESIGLAFDAAMHIGELWQSPDGPAVVVDVDPLVNEAGRSQYSYAYRLISDWGKEAYR